MKTIYERDCSSHTHTVHDTYVSPEMLIALCTKAIREDAIFEVVRDQKAGTATLEFTAKEVDFLFGVHSQFIRMQGEWGCNE